jgi:hypothetical protein
MQNIVINLLMLLGQMEQFDMFMLHPKFIGIENQTHMFIH